MASVIRYYSLLLLFFHPIPLSLPLLPLPLPPPVLYSCALPLLYIFPTISAHHSSYFLLLNLFLFLTTIPQNPLLLLTPIFHRNSPSPPLLCPFQNQFPLLTSSFCTLLIIPQAPNLPLLPQMLFLH